MKRRSLLVLLAPGVTGCLSSDSARDEEQSIPDGAEEPPPFPDADEVIYPACDGGRIEMTATPQEAELPESTIEFQATNTHFNLFETNFEDWRMHTLVDGEWWFLGVFDSLDVLDHLAPTGSHSWEMTIDNDRLGTTAEQLAPSASPSFTVAGLGSGIYTFSIVGEFAGADTTSAIVTPFELGGEDVAIVPTSNVETTREGATVHVTETDDDGWDHKIVATRRASTGEATRLTPEWGLRQPGIRNTVPFLSDGVRKVVYSRSRPLVHASDRTDGGTFAYEGRAVEFDLTDG